MSKLKTVISSAAALGIIGVVAVSTSLPTYFAIKNNINTKTYVFDGKTYTNFEELFNDVSSKYLKSSTNVNERYKWSINDGGNLKYYNDPTQLRNELMKLIKSTSGYSSDDIEGNSSYFGANNELSADAIAKIYNGNYDDLKQQIYRGKNNSIHTSELSAKKSYLSIHDAYYFNNLFFQNKEQLELYLNSQYFNEDNNNPTSQAQNVVSVLNQTKGSKSNAINQDLLFSILNNTTNEQNKNDILDAKKSFANFINLSSNKYLQIKNFSQAENKDMYTYYKDGEITSSSQLINDFNNPDYTRLYENEGNAMYVVDLDQDDKANLYGSYFVSSTKELEMMKDTKNWYQITSSSRFIAKQKDAALISNIFDFILFPDDNVDLPINISPLNESLIIPYFDQLKLKHSNIYNRFSQLMKDLNNGVNFNSFYGLLISYVYLLNNLINDQASEAMIKETKDLFDKIATFADQIIYLIFPSNILVGKNNEKVSFKKVFNFKDNNKNLNTDVDYYVDIISENHPQFIVTLSIMSFAITNSLFNGSAIEFKYDKLSNMLAASASYQEQRMEEKYKDDYKFIYDLFSTSNLEGFYNKLTQSSQYARSNINTLTRQELVKKMALQNFLKLNFSKFPAEIDYFDRKTIFTSSSSSSGNNVILYVSNENSVFYKMSTSIANKIITINNNATTDEEKISFTNFMLIKMLSSFKVNESVILNMLYKYENKILNQESLYNELDSMLNKLSNEQFAKNFQIIQNSMEIHFTVSKTPNYEYNVNNQNKKYVTAAFEGFEWVYDKINSFIGDLKTMKESSSVAQLSSAIKKLGKVSAIFGWVGIAISCVTLLIEAFMPETEYISYVFETQDGKKYIWDGGEKTTMLWGLVETSSVGIDQMKLIGPKKIFDGNNKEEYYFDGNKYDTLNELKTDQLRKIINGRYQNESIKNVYSWENLDRELTSVPEHVFDMENLGSADSILNIDLQTAASSSFVPQDLVQYVYHKIAVDIVNNNKNSKYFTSSFMYAGGITSGGSSDKNTIIQEILKDIKSIKIAQLPKLDENLRPISKDQAGDDGSIGEFVLPSKSWNLSIVSYNNTNNQYIIYDPNISNEGSQQYSISDADVVKIIEQQFIEQFMVDTKYVIKHDVHTTNLYSELTPNVNAYQIYNATIWNGESNNFLNLSDALNWLLTKMEFTMYEYSKVENIYEYNGIIFNSKEEFRNYILENAEVKNA